MYGGVTFGFSRNHYRVFAPNGGADPNKQGAIVNTGTGYGNNVLRQNSSSALVRVRGGVESSPDFDSGWFDVTAGVGDSYFQFNHSLGVIPARVRVIAKATTGQDNGFVFNGCGAAMVDKDEAESVSEDAYGGVVFAYSDTSVQVWTASPVGLAGSPNAHLITTGMRGWGVHTPGITTSPYKSGRVRVMVWRDGQVPDFESPWIAIRSCSTTDAYLEIAHGLGESPWGGQGYRSGCTSFPHATNLPRLSSCRQPQPIPLQIVGFKSVGLLCQGTVHAGVCVWLQTVSLTGLKCSWLTTTTCSRGLIACLRPWEWPRGRYVERALVSKCAAIARASPTLPPNARLYHAGAACRLVQGYDAATVYSGVVFGYNASIVRVWAPTLDNRTTTTMLACGGTLFSVRDGYVGTGPSLTITNGLVRVRCGLFCARLHDFACRKAGFHCVHCLPVPPREPCCLSRPLCLQVRAWSYWQYPALDFVDVSVRVADVAEPPVAQSARLYLGNAFLGDLVGVLLASDEDATSALSFRVTAGDPLGAFNVTSTGRIYVARPSLLLVTTTFHLSIAVSDGVLEDHITVPISIDGNFPPELAGATFFVAEGSPVNTYVGTELNATGTLRPCTLPPGPAPCP